MRFVLALLAATTAHAGTFYVTVAGLGGEPEYEQRFAGLASDASKAVAGAAGAKAEALMGAGATKKAISGIFDRLASDVKATDILVVQLVGHGTWDGADYKFNLPGPDLSGTELAAMLDKVPAKRQLIVNTTSSSGGSVRALRREGRVIVSATQSGTEKNATVFARYWVEALRDPTADADKNDTVSALEAYRYAQRKTQQYYEQAKRLATEHSVIEDTGKNDPVRTPSQENGIGIVAGSFPLLRVGTTAAAANDPERAKLIARKDEIEQEIDRLKYQKAAMPGDEYRKRLGAMLVDLAKVQRELDK